jgi:peptidoglycan/LPS O-acetylase OafA/YrhL
MALLVLSLVALLLGMPATEYTGLYELVVVLVIFPVLVLAASFVEPVPDAKLEKTFAIMGLTSYAIYILQASFIWAYSAVFRKYEHTTILPGVIAIIALFALSFLLDLYYDQPVRRWMRKKIS